MFNQLFTSYLVQKQALDKERADEVLKEQRATRVRIGTLAIEEGLMTPGQVELVNHLQSVKNERFGDIAIEEGFITHETLSSLLVKQPKEHIILRQILADKGYMTDTEFEEELLSLTHFLGITPEYLARLQDNDIGLFLTLTCGMDEAPLVDLEYAALFIKLVLRLIDREVFAQAAETTPEITVKYAVSQACSGDESLTMVFASDDDQALIQFAEAYASVSFDSLGEDARDSLGEFLNCVSGMLVSKLSNDGKLELDIEPPVISIDRTFSSDKGIMILPCTILSGNFNVFVIKER